MRVELRRRVYIGVALIGIVMCVVETLTGAPDWRSHVTYPLLTCYLIIALALLVRAVRYVVVVERTGFWFVLAVWLTEEAVGMLSGAAADDPAAAWAALSPMILLTMALLVVLAYVWYPTRAALWVSLVPPLASTIIGLVRYLPDAAAGDSSYLRMLVEAELYLFVTAAFVFLLATNKDLLAASRLETDRLRQLANQDALTGLSNRRGLAGLLDAAGATETSVVSVDIDHFKQVNDSFGHDVGDAVLVEVAALMRLAAPADAVLARWGGEEFVIVLPAATRATAYELAERLRVMLASHPFPEGIQITASFGVAGQGDTVDGSDDGLVPDPAERPGIDQLIRAADQRLYLAKGRGRNTVA